MLREYALIRRQVQARGGVLEKWGHFFKSKECPISLVHTNPDYERFLTAIQLALTDPRLVYVEGVSVLSGKETVDYHGWCINLQDHRVIDLPWGIQRVLYFGVPIRTDAVSEFLKETPPLGGLLPVLSQWPEELKWVHPEFEAKGGLSERTEDDDSRYS